MAKQSFTDLDAGKTAEQKFSERSKRLQDAMQLKQPDRIPIQLFMSYMLAEMYGVTRQEQHENAEKKWRCLKRQCSISSRTALPVSSTTPGPARLLATA